MQAKMVDAPNLTEEAHAARKIEAQETSSVLDETLTAARMHNQVMKDFHAEEHKYTKDGIAMEAARVAREKDLYAAFKIFDTVQYSEHKC